MGQAIGHEQCPKCARDGRDVHRDNLARYSDGSAFCFSCGYYISSNAIEKHLQTRKSTNGNQPTSRPTCTLPPDSTTEIPKHIWDWLRNYAITEIDLKVNHVLWSKEKQMLIFPLFIAGELIAWHGRYFGTEKRAKAYTTGSLKDVYYILGNAFSDTLVLVEDIISAIRISKIPDYCSMPLFGSVINVKQLLTLHNRYNNILIWLDNDKQMYSRNTAIKARQLGINAKSVISTLDPKYYNDDNIESFIKT